MSKKIKLLAWCDLVAHTGFSNVAEHVLKALYSTGLYDIDVLAINYHGDFLDKERYPYQIVPAKLKDPKDPYGKGMFVRSLENKAYDAVWIINDVYVVEPVSRAVTQMKEAFQNRGKTPPCIFYYFPIDSKLLPGYSGMIKVADVPVAYTQFALDETLKTVPSLKSKNIPIIYHGVDTSVFRPLSLEERSRWRRDYLKVEDDTFVIINVNRNSERKQLTRTLLAFEEFRKHVPKSKLYVHAAPRDSGIDLFSACNDLGFDIRRDVIFPDPRNFSPSKGYPAEVLNRFYNAADCFLTTTLGEGYGLCAQESLAAEIPVVVPDNTVHPEIFGEDGERALIYDCKELIWVDNTAYRPLGRVEDIVEKLLQVYNEPLDAKRSRAKRGREWCVKNDWKEIGEQWISLFNRELSSRKVKGEDTSRIKASLV